MIPSEDWSWRLERSPSNEIVLPFVSPRTEIRRIKDNAFEVQTDRIGTCGGLVLQIIPFRILLEYEYNSIIDTTFNGNRKTFIVDSRHKLYIFSFRILFLLLVMGANYFACLQ